MSLDSNETTAPVEGGSQGFSIDDDVHHVTPEEIAAVTEPRSPSEAIAAAERPPWLEEKFRTPEDLVKSYHEAENKIRAQGTELNQLREIAAAYQQTAANEQLLAAEIEADPTMAAFSDGLRQRSAQAALAIDLEARQRMTEQAFANVPGLAEHFAAQQNAPVEHAQQIAALLDQHVPDHRQFEPQIQEAIMRNPHLFADPDPKTVAQRIAGVVNNVRSERAQLEATSFRPDGTVALTEMKQLAQTATGAGTRAVPPGEAEREWAEITKAGRGSYWEPR